MEKEIDFVQFFKFFKRKLLMVILFLLAGLGLSYIYSTYFVTPQYSSSAQIVVNQRTGEGTNPQIMTTYLEMIKSPAILSDVQTNLDEPVSMEELTSNISVTNPQNTQVLSTSYTTDNPNEAAEITNTIADSFKYVIESIMNRDEEILITYYGVPNSTPVSLSPFITMIIGSLVGLMTGVLVVGILFLTTDPTTSVNKVKNTSSAKHHSKITANLTNVFHR